MSFPDATPRDLPIHARSSRWWFFPIALSRRGVLSIAMVGVLTIPMAANATFPAWLQHIVGASTLESALYRAMEIPGAQALYPRPPKEAANELSLLIAKNSDDAELYQLRAQSEEQALNESAAEADWKQYAAHAPDRVAAQLELADFYQRRLMIPQEIAILRQVADKPAIAAESYIDPARQRSWLAFERILGAIHQQGLPAPQTADTFNAFLNRYADQPAIYAAFLEFELDQQDWPAAQSLIARYSHQFPNDAIFPIRARAQIDFRRGNIDAALAVYDRTFEPLWPAALIDSYFALLEQTHRQRAFVALAREQLAGNPDGPEALNALARIFYYEQHARRTDSAIQTLDAFRIERDRRKAPWTPADLYTLAALSESVHAYAETARYDYALASTTGDTPNGEPAAQSGLAGLISILLEAPEQPLAIGSQNLTLYRDIATLDQGPGYWNGILSLWLNGESAASEYQSETSRAQSYFHRAKAAELLADLDKRFSEAPERAHLHAELIRALAQYGEPATVIIAAKQYLTNFSSAPERLDVVNLMAEAYARQNDTASEFALYESELDELASRTSGYPLTSSANAPPSAPQPGTVHFYVRVQDPDSVDSNAGAAQKLKSQLLADPPTRPSLPEGTAYAGILDRYLGRLTATGQLPRALSVLRGQLDHNPNDPQLYERLATFLQQNNLSAQQEQVYEQAIARFAEPSYYDKLARFYLRTRKRTAFAKLTRQVTDIFSGTDLDRFFANVQASQPVGSQLALQLNLYAAKRFPHDLVFTRNLLTAYQAKQTKDTAAYEALLRRQWWASDEFRDEFLTYLSRSGKLASELSQLESLKGLQDALKNTEPVNPAALREQAEINIFTSHFEEAVPLLGSVTDLYPSDPDTGDRAISLCRSMAYLDSTPASTQRAVAIEQNLLTAAPDSPDRLAILGDLYAEATSTGGEGLASAAPYWHRIPDLHPGSAQGFLTSSTLFWDYFQFDDALSEVTTARTRFHAPALFGYEAGAIEENRHNLQAAVSEYTNSVVHPIAIPRHFDSAFGTIEAWLKPPSDAGDSNFRSTAQNFFGSEESKARLIQLATRSATRAGVDAATSKAVSDDPANIAALTLRADVLAAQHHAPDLAPLMTDLFDHALDRASTLDEVAAIGALAQTRSLMPVYERFLAKQAALTLDPVQKIELQYSLARSLDSRGDLSAAARIIGDVHAANPRLLGVIRTTTDFYLRVNQPSQAIATLLNAAKVATPALARDFTLEAASRANDANNTQQARTLATGLLTQTPYDARVLDVVATSYARAHDDAGLKQFYLAQLATARTAPGLTSDARKQDIAVLRRGLIPALTRLNDAHGAIEQYIALLSAFPDDAHLGEEASLYALKHNVQPQLLDFLHTTVKQSPNDSRFMILLAAAETTFDDLPAAESAYSLAINIRKDRVDLYTARADIAMRLSLSDPAQSELAAADFERLYLLTYHDPSWMLGLAELRARQKRPADAVKALEIAYIEGHARSAGDFFTVARQLESWGLLSEARAFAEQGISLTGPDLLTPPIVNTYSQPEIGAVTIARILVRIGQADQALSILIKARNEAEISATSPTALAKELARENISGDEAAGFRQNFATQHRAVAEQNLKAAVEALGQAVQTYNTPEQKQVLALVLDKLHDSAQSNSNPSLALDVATAAGLADREAAWRKQDLLTAELDTTKPNTAAVSSYVALQQSRLEFSELAHVLEAYAARLLPSDRSMSLTQSAQAFRDAGDFSNELRLTRTLVLGDHAQLQERLFDLLQRSDPEALTALASNHNIRLADAALNFTVAHSSETHALAAVASRGRSLDPVWTPASASLVRTYFAGSTSSSESSSADRSDFKSALATESTIASRLASPTDPKRQLTGDTFFYYASRFGIFAATVPRPADEIDPIDTEDYLPAELEGSPASIACYLNLARTYVETHNIAAAEAEYNHALELSPDDPTIEDELAISLYQAGHHDTAITHWHKSLAILSRMQQHAVYPEFWFTTLEAVARHVGQNHLTAPFRSKIEAIVGPYLAKNATYRSNELLKAIYQASPTPEEGANFILAVVDFASEQNEILDDLNRQTWLTEEAREFILLRQIDFAGNHAQQEESHRSLIRYQQKLIDLYLAQNQLAKAQNIYDSISEKHHDDKADQSALDIDRTILAVRANHLQSLIESWRANPDSVPTESITTALARLAQPTAAYKPDLTAIRPLREFLFEYKRQNGSLLPSDYLALAEIRLNTGDLAGAIDLLHQLTLQPPSSHEGNGTPLSNPYGNSDEAASLLETTHHPSEAIPFLESLMKSVPWKASYRLRLAQAQFASHNSDQARINLLLVAREATAPYPMRVQAAAALTPLTSTHIELGSAELAFIAYPSAAAAARQPWFAEARIALAETPSTSLADRELLLREAIAINPNSPNTARARLNLLLLQKSTADPSATLAILHSIQNSPAQSSYDNNTTGAGLDSDADAPIAEDPPTSNQETAPGSTDDVAVPSVSLPPTANKLDLPTRIRLAAQIASAYERDGNLESALAYAKLAVDLAINLTKRVTHPDLAQRRDHLMTAILLERRNSVRRPHLSAQLAQSTQVRPQLTASTVTSEGSQ